VVIPTRERATSLARCLAGLAELDYPAGRVEVVVAIDGVDDRASARVVSSYANRLPVTLVQLPRGGPGPARNAGAARAGGRFLAFTDDDCVPDVRWLAGFAAALKDDPDVAVGGLAVNRIVHSPYSIASQVILEATYAHCNPPGRPPSFFATNNLALPADAFRRIGGFDESFRYAEDREFCARWLAQGGAMKWVPDAVVYHLRDLDLRSMLRQHAGYGRGAYQFHRSRSSPLRVIPALEAGFYRHLVVSCLTRRAQVGRYRLGGLVAAAQAANGFGFAAALARTRGRPHQTAGAGSAAWDRTDSGNPQRSYDRAC
jgi:GT2 family glycosyltransferase